MRACGARGPLEWGKHFWCPTKSYVKYLKSYKIPSDLVLILTFLLATFLLGLVGQCVAMCPTSWHQGLLRED